MDFCNKMCSFRNAFNYLIGRCFCLKMNTSSFRAAITFGPQTTQYFKHSSNNNNNNNSTNIAKSQVIHDDIQSSNQQNNLRVILSSLPSSSPIPVNSHRESTVPCSTALLAFAETGSKPDNSIVKSISFQNDKVKLALKSSEDDYEDGSERKKDKDVETTE